MLIQIADMPGDLEHDVAGLLRVYINTEGLNPV